MSPTSHIPYTWYYLLTLIPFMIVTNQGGIKINWGQIIGILLAGGIAGLVVGYMSITRIDITVENSSKE